MNPFLSTEQRQIVVFPIWASLPYWKRMLLGIGLIFFGFYLQYLWWNVPFVLVHSYLILVAGNLFLLVKGYDNRVNFGKYTPVAGWEQVGAEKLKELRAFVKEMKRWDRSAIDISNPLGKFTFFSLLLIIAALFVAGIANDRVPLLVLAGDALLILLMHWISGQRSIQSQPDLFLKLDVFKKLQGHRKLKARLQAHTIDYFLLLKGKDTLKVPENVKIRVNVHDQHDDFLGYYGQIVINRVSDKKYPYFYVVLVAKKGYGLKRLYGEYETPHKIVKEFKKQDDVEVLVIRQKTTKTSGYHTKDRDMRRILLQGLGLAEQAARK